MVMGNSRVKTGSKCPEREDRRAGTNRGREPVAETEVEAREDCWEFKGLMSKGDQSRMLADETQKKSLSQRPSLCSGPLCREMSKEGSSEQTPGMKGSDPLRPNAAK